MRRFSIVLAALAVCCAAPVFASTPFDRLQFRNLGPQVSGGRLGAVAGTDADSSLYYAGAAGGGVWKTTNAGQSWTPVFDREDCESIGAIAVDPSNENVVWVGTGEGAPRNDVSTGNGLYKTADGGKTWQRVLALRHALIARILIDPHNTGTVLVGVLGDPFADSSDRGAYRTTDGGKTWRKTLYVDARTGVSDMAAAEKTPGVVYAGMWPYRRTGWSSDSGGAQGGLYRSADFGATWRRLSGDGLPQAPTGRIGVAVAPSNPDRVYALIETKHGLLWRSDDAGASWRMISANTLIDERPFYYTHVYVDPRDQNHVWALSVRVAVSEDGGKTWKVGARGVHGDNHAMWISADSKRIIEANDGGPSFSFDDGKTWAMPHNLPIAQLYHVGFDRLRPYHVCAPLQDNGIWCAPENALTGGGITSSNWLSMGGGDGTWAVPDPRDPRIIWTSSGGGSSAGELSWIDTRTNETHSVQPYMRDQNVVNPRDLAYRFNWEMPFAFDPFDGRRIWAGGNVMFTSTDRGARWHVVSGDLTRNVRSHQVVTGGITLDGTGAETSDTILYVEPSRVRRGEVWAGTDDGYVQLTLDGGKHWRNVTPADVRGAAGNKRYGRFAALSASPRDAATLYAIYDLHMVGDRTPHVYATHDYGAHWIDLGAGLPRDAQARSVRVDPRNPRLLYVGLENGLWASFDGGTRWRNLASNMPAASVRDIQVQPAANDLLVATHGRGVYVLDDVTPLQQWHQSSSSRIFPVRAAYQWNLQDYWGTRTDGEDPPYGAIVTYYLNAPAKNVSAMILDTNGRAVRHFSGSELTGFPGFNRFDWDTAQDGPANWVFAPAWNRGFDEGAPVLPGTYTVVVHAGPKTLRGTIAVKQDPRTHYTAAQLRDGQRALSSLFDDFDRVDRALNMLSTVLDEAPLRAGALRAAGNGQLAQRVESTATRARSLLLSITQNPANGQDDDFLVDVLRERLQWQIGYSQSTFGPPSQEQLREDAALRALTQNRMRAFAEFSSGVLAPVDAALRAAKQPPLTTATRPPHVVDTGE